MNHRKTIKFEYHCEWCQKIVGQEDLRELERTLGSPNSVTLAQCCSPQCYTNLCITDRSNTQKRKEIFEVFKSPCKRCLYSEDRLVSEESAKGIIKDCVNQESYFECHVSSLQDQRSICCHNFFKQDGDKSLLIRLAKQLGVVSFVDMPEDQS